VTYAEIEAHQGHDAFLMPIPRYLDIFRGYMQKVAQEITP
jgi:homoserine O-acetyltransferase